MIRELPLQLQTIYADLLDRADAEAFDQDVGGGAFVVKEIKGRRYWYVQERDGPKRRQKYVGPETPELLTKVERHRQVQSDRRDRESLVNALVTSGGLPRPLAAIGAVVEALARAGAFRLRAVLIGTVAYQTYPGVLGCRMPSTHLQTSDVDVAQFKDVSALTEDHLDIDMLALLRSVDASFRAVPNRRDGRRTHCYTATGGLRVDFLTPNRGPETDEPATLPALRTDAQALRFLDYLIRETEPAMILYGAGVLVSVPRAERFAVHKMLVSRRRQRNSPKREKDLRQAEALFRVLTQKRPKLLGAAFDEAWERGHAWRDLLLEGLSALDSMVRDLVLQTIARTRSFLPRLRLDFKAPPMRYDATRAVIMFDGEAGGARVRCEVSREALDDHYGTDGMTSEQRTARALEQRAGLEALARRKYLHWPIEQPDVVLIRTNEVERLKAESQL